MRHHPLPPGPTRWNAFKTVPRLLENPIRYLRQMHSIYGDVAYVRLLTRPAYYVQDPELVEDILVRNARAYSKDILLRELKPLMGDGLLTSEGSFWRRQRKLASPFLARRQIELYADDMRRLAADYVQVLQEKRDVDIHREMTALTLAIVNKTLFGSDLSANPSRVGHNLDVVMDYFYRVSRSLRRYIPTWVPTRDNRNAANAIAELDSVVFAIIDQRHAEGASGNDLLSRLLAVRDEDGTRMSNSQVRDEVITLFLAGHETTALALSNTLWLLSEHTDVEAKLLDEVRSLQDGFSLEALESLSFLDAVLKESMRLYPPAWSVAREAKETTQLGPYRVPRGTQLYMSQYLMHRDARLFDAPETFRPERWLDGSCQALSRFAYFPFGGGPRVCIGNHFALMELKTVLVTLLRALRFRHRPGHRVSFTPSVTMRPNNGMPMEVISRASQKPDRDRMPAS
ncbi:MAG: cytochrome P450 [Myxococcota bacterium]